MTTHDKPSDVSDLFDPSFIYDVGGINAVQSLEYALAEETEDTILVSAVQALLKATKELIVEQSDRDLTQFLMDPDQVERLLEKTEN